MYQISEIMWTLPWTVYFGNLQFTLVFDVAAAILVSETWVYDFTLAVATVKKLSLLIVTCCSSSKNWVTSWLLAVMLAVVSDCSLGDFALSWMQTAFPYHETCQHKECEARKWTDLRSLSSQNIYVSIMIDKDPWERNMSLQSVLCVARQRSQLLQCRCMSHYCIKP